MESVLWRNVQLYVFFFPACCLSVSLAPCPGIERQEAFDSLSDPGVNASIWLATGHFARSSLLAYSHPGVMPARIFSIFMIGQLSGIAGGIDFPSSTCIKPQNKPHLAQVIFPIVAPSVEV